MEAFAKIERHCEQMPKEIRRAIAQIQFRVDCPSQNWSIVALSAFCSSNPAIFAPKAQEAESQRALHSKCGLRTAS